MYYVTAFFSIFAYLVDRRAHIDHPNQVDLWEAPFTLVCFPILLIAAYAADQGWLSNARVTGIMPASHIVEYDGMQFKPHQAEALVKAMQEKKMSEEEQARCSPVCPIQPEDLVCAATDGGHPEDDGQSQEGAAQGQQGHC